MCIFSMIFFFFFSQHATSWGCIFHPTEVCEDIKALGWLVRDVDCLNNTVQHRQWSLCIRLFSGDDYSSGDRSIDSPRRRNGEWAVLAKHTTKQRW